MEQKYGLTNTDTPVPFGERSAMASNCVVKALNRVSGPLFELFLAFLAISVAIVMSVIDF